MLSMLPINASIIQGSGLDYIGIDALGPVEYMFSLPLICPLSHLPIVSVNMLMIGLPIS